MTLREQQAAIQKELDRFVELLKVVQPRHALLLKKEDLNELETKELGDLEYFLMEVNAQIAVIKQRLENELFGRGLQTYYQTKSLANSGNENARRKLGRLRKSFENALDNGSIICWN